MRCDEVENLAMRYVDGRLGPEQARNFDAHLDVCPRCRKVYAEEVELVAAFHTGGLHPVGDELVQDVMRQVATLEAGPGPSSRSLVRIRPLGVVALAAAAAAALVLLWQTGTATWAGWTASVPVGELAVRLGNLQRTAADGAAAVAAPVEGLGLWVSRLMGAGEVAVGAASHQHTLLIAMLTAAAAVACVGLVRGFRKEIRQ